MKMNNDNRVTGAVLVGTII